MDMIQNQVYVFFWSILVGVILALIFDFFRLMRRKGKIKNIVVYLQDVLYWIIVTFIIILSAFLTNNGELRGYMFFGYIIGAIFYLLIFSKLFLKISGSIIDFIEKFLKNIRKFCVKNYT